MKLRRTLLLLAAALAAGTAFSEPDATCEGFEPPVWDYTDKVNWRPSGDAPQSRIKLVENVHFQTATESLLRGRTAVSPVGDIEYTIRRFPNHARALWALSRASRHAQWKTDVKPSRVECFLERAIQFNRKDAAVWLVYGMHLHSAGEHDAAEEKYVRAGELGLNTSDYHYNFGLLLVDKGDFEGARKQAEIAYRLGYPLPGLRKKLAAAGHWPKR